jgi:competence protein ComEC
VSGGPRARATARPRATDLRLLLPAVLGWAIAAATLGAATAVRAALVGAFALAGLVVVLAGARRAPARVARWPVLLVLLVAALLQVAAATHGILRDRGDVAALARERATVHVQAVVTGDPIELGGRADDERRVLREATVLALSARGRVVRTRAPVLLTGGSELVGPPWRSSVELHGRLGPVDAADDRVATLAPLGELRVTAPPGAIAAGAERLRAGLRRAVDGAPDDARGLLPGLVIGDTARTPEALTAAMRATGMTHLTAVSGANVAVVVGMVLGACGVLGVPRPARPVLAGVALAGFVVLARPDPSVVRAAAMGAIGLLGLSRSRRSAGPPVLAGAVIAVLVVDPWLARSYGFALSTLATLGLLLFSRPWGDALGERLPARLAPLGPALAVPVAAQVATAPVIVLLQGSVSLVGVLANLLAAPFVPPATIAGVLAALVSVLWDRGAALVAWLGVLPTQAIAWIAHACAEVPGGTLPWPDGAPGAVLLAALLVGVLLTGRALVVAVAAHPVLVVGALALSVAALLPTRLATWPPERWRVVACDVGQGDAVVLRSGPGRAVLVDTGPEPALADRCLDRLGVHVLDAVVLTHFHADHVGGLVGALRGRAVRQVLVSPVAEPGYRAEEVRHVTAREHVPLVVLRAGDRLRLGAVDALVWSPWHRIDAGSVPNNASVVLAARVGRVDALLLGDVEREAAHDLLLRIRRDPQMAATAAGLEVVKTPHHGSSNLDDELMALVRAPVGIISVGADNDYGHPAPHHLGLLRRLGYAVYRTDERGDVAVVERGAGVAVVTAR